MVESLRAIDMKTLEYINKHCKNRLFDKIMPIITLLGNFGVVWIITSIFLLKYKHYRFEGIMIISSLCLSTIIGEGIIKHLVRRARPFTKMNEDRLLIPKPITYSFPSGHSASSFAAAGVFVSMNNWISGIAIILASLIAFSRLYLKVHYPLDVISGVVLGILCSMIVLSTF